MTDQDYENAKKRFEIYAEKWHPLMQMGWYTIKYEYLRDFFDDDVDTIATCKPSWVYRRAMICVSMRKVHELSNEELENAVVHEFCHIVLAPATQDQPEGWHEQIEYTTETVAVILLNIVNGTGAMSHDNPKKPKTGKAN